MDATTLTPSAPSPRANRNVPVERWPESLAILNHLAQGALPHSIRAIARAVDAPEISTRNRLRRLQMAGAVRAQRGPVATPSGKSAVGTQYFITQFGRDCASGNFCNARVPNSASTAATGNVWQHATSVFAWGARIVR